MLWGEGKGRALGERRERREERRRGEYTFSGLSVGTRRYEVRLWTLLQIVFVVSGLIQAWRYLYDQFHPPWLHGERISIQKSALAPLCGISIGAPTQSSGAGPKSAPAPLLFGQVPPQNPGIAGKEGGPWATKTHQLSEGG